MKLQTGQRLTKNQIKPFFRKKYERPEQEFQIRVVRERLEPMVKNGQLLDFHAVPNELVGMLYLKFPWAAQIAKKMGVKKGVADLVLRAIVQGQGRVCWMELKSDVGTMQETQEEFRGRTLQGGWKHYVVRPDGDDQMDEFDAAMKDFLSDENLIKGMGGAISEVG